MKTALSKVKNTFCRINGRLDTAEEKINELENKVIETIQDKTKKRTFKKLLDWSQFRYNVSPGAGEPARRGRRSRGAAAVTRVPRRGERPRAAALAGSARGKEKKNKKKLLDHDYLAEQLQITY